MDSYTIQILYNSIVRGISDFFHSSVFQVFEFFAAVYVIILFIDLVLLIIQRGPGKNWRQMRYGVDIPSELVTKKDKMKEQWSKIKKRLESENESEYKVAIIEADTIIDDLITRMGYKGANMSERLANIPEGQLAELGEMKEAHEIRNRIIHEEDFKVDRDFAKGVLKKYEHLLHHFEVLD
ncbi:MAG: hypothetical protein WCX17_04260 [Parcubacteria group bacterium]|jgi:hypothetical protein